jgi:hypothetical protein
LLSTADRLSLILRLHYFLVICSCLSRSACVLRYKPTLVATHLCEPWRLSSCHHPKRSVAAAPPIGAALLASFGSWGDRRDDDAVWVAELWCAFLHPETTGKTLAYYIRRRQPAPTSPRRRTAPVGHVHVPALVPERGGRFREVTRQAKNSWNRL